jgi:methylmalonyl-CoA carboxyltransferase large subunit
MVETIPQELVSILEDLRKQVASLSDRVANLEPPAPAPPVAPSVSAAPAPQGEASESITEDELLAISGALAAYLGVRVHIRQIRLISSSAWASQGRASIQASHRLHS